jgi:hypothetical protein
MEVKSELEKYGRSESEFLKTIPKEEIDQLEKIKKHSQFEQYTRSNEIFATIWHGPNGPRMANNCYSSKDSKFCDDMLGKVNRDFAAATRQLPKGLCMEVLVFFLAVKALNIIADDTKYFDGNNGKKADCLRNFYCTALVTDGWKLDGMGVENDQVLLKQFYRCANIFKNLSIGSQEIITDIIKKMGEVR